MKVSSFFQIFIAGVFLMVTADVAFSGFSVRSIGSSKGLLKTRIADQMNELQSVLDDPDGTITSKQLSDLNIDLSSFGGYPLDDHHLAYLKHMLNGQNIGKTQASFQNIIQSSLTDNTSACPNSNCGLGAADWQHELVSTDNSSDDYDDWTMITAGLLDDLIGMPGYTNAVLGANSSKSISDVYNDDDFQIIANAIGVSSLPDNASLLNVINRIGGFVGEVAADADNPTSGDYTTAQSIVDAFRLNSDYGSFNYANYVACYNNTESDRSGGANTCNVSASFWSSQSSILSSFSTFKQNITDNTTVTQADLVSLGLDLTSLGSPVEDWQIDYLNTQLSDNATLVSDWQTTINGFNKQTAALWKINLVASGASGHPDSHITNYLLNNAIGSSFSAATVFNVGSSKSASGFAGAAAFDNLTSPSNTAANVKSELLSYVGFTTAQYNNWDNNSDKANFTLADFIECFENTETARSGGSNNCTVSSSAWSTQSTYLSNFASAKQDVADNTTLTLAQLTDIGLTTGALGDSPVATWKLQYLGTQLSTSAGLISDWQTTIDAFDNASAAQWKVGQVAAGVSGHSDSDITTALLDLAIGSSFSSSSVLGVGNSTTASGFAGDSLFDNLVSPNNSASNIKSNLLSYIGFTTAQYNAWDNNSDKTSFTVGNYVSCFNNTEDNRSGGSNACTVTASYWSSMSSILQLFTEAKQDVTDNNTVTISQLQALGITTSNIGSDDYQIEYANSLLSDNASSISEWQTALNGYDNASAARWKVGKIAGSDNTNHPRTDLTLAMFDIATGSSSGTTQSLLNFGSRNINQLRNHINSASFGENPTVSELNSRIASLVGMSSGTSAEQYASNSDAASFNKYDWNACFNSSNSSTGGANKCTPTFAAWRALNLTDINVFRDVVRAIYDTYGAGDSTTLANISKQGKVSFYCRQLYLFCQISTTMSTHTSNSNLQGWMTCDDHLGGTEGWKLRGQKPVGRGGYVCSNGGVLTKAYGTGYPNEAVTGWNSGGTPQRNYGVNRIVMGRP